MTLAALVVSSNKGNVKYSFGVCRGSGFPLLIRLPVRVFVATLFNDLDNLVSSIEMDRILH